MVRPLFFAKRHRFALGVPDYRDPFGDGFPGPYLTLTVEWEGRTRDILALLDTGAHLTQIPQPIAEAMRLEQVEEMDTTSPHGDTHTRPVYVANIRFEGLEFPATWVVGDAYGFALIGRDILNELIACFDGPGLSFGLQRPTAPAAS